MQTIIDLIAKARRLPTLSEVSGGPLRAYKPKSKLYVPGEGAISLPIDERGMAPIVDFETSAGNFNVQESMVARMHLLRFPGITFPLPSPSADYLRELGIDVSKFRSENPRRVGVGVAIRVADQVVYGIADLIVVENGIRMGSSQLVEFRDQWTYSLEEVEEWIFEMICRTNSSLVSPSPEPNSEPWKTVVLLLGGSDMLPDDWKRRFRLAAGLRKIRLDIQVNPDPAKSRVIRDLRTTPPDALLVWADWISNPDVYLAPYRSAHKDGIADVLGSPDQGMSFDEATSELLMHMREIVPLSPYVDEQQVENEVLTWAQGKTLLLELCGPHIVLTANANEMLVNNPYPHVGRMLKFFESLASLAERFRANRGQLGARLADFAQSEFGIEIALFDSRLDGIEIEYEGERFRIGPHVKVDDYKNPDACGRIYFSLDSGNFRFIVDHIGLHNYRE